MKRNFLLMLLLTLLPLAGWSTTNYPITFLAQETETDDLAQVNGAEYGTTYWDFRIQYQIADSDPAEYEDFSEFVGEISWYFCPANKDTDDPNNWESNSACPVTQIAANEFSVSGDAGTYRVTASNDDYYWSGEFQVGEQAELEDLTIWYGATQVDGATAPTTAWGSLTVKYGDATLDAGDWAWQIKDGDEFVALPNPYEPAEGNVIRAVYNAAVPNTTPTYVYSDPFEFDDDEGPVTPITDNIVVVQVTPQSGLKIPYATPVEEILVTPSMISTNCNAFYSADNKQKIADLLMIVNAEAISEAAAGSNPELRFALIDDESEDGNVIDDLGDGVTYIIEPISANTIEVVKAQNKLIEGNGVSGFAFDLIKGIPYTGEPQNLVKPVSSTFNFTSFSGEGLGANELGKGTAKVVRVNRENNETIAEIEVTKNEPAGTTTAEDAESFEGQRFYVYADPTTIPTRRLELYTWEDEHEEPNLDYDPEDPTSEENIIVPAGYFPTGMWVSVEAGVESWAKFGEKKGVEFLTISKTAYDELEDAPADPANYSPAADDANWDTEIPQGTEIDKYYVWARAAAGENWVAGDAKFVSDYASIVKGKATFEWTNDIADVYYVNPSGKYGITREKKNIDFGTVKVTPAAAQSLVKWGYNVWEGEGEPTTTAQGWSSVAEIVEGTEETTGTVFEEGKIYRVFPYVPADDNFVLSGPAFATRKVFTVEKPSVVFQTTPASNVIGYDTEDGLTFGIDNGTWAEFDGSYQIADNGLEYVWYEDKECTEEAETDDEGNYPAGKTYYVRAEEPEDIAIDDETHVIKEIKPAQIFITPGDIYAHVEQDVELVFGQTLPLNLIYENGAYDPGSDEIEEFEEKTWDGLLKATKIDPKTGEPVADVNPIILNDHKWTTGRGRDAVNHYATTILPVGTWKVGAAEVTGQESNVLVIGSGTWTITPKNIKNEDFTNPAVVGNDVLNHVSKTYTSQEITLDEDDFGDELTYRADGDPHINNVALGIVYGNLTLGEDFEITGYTNNINAGTATVSIEGKGNFVGERDLTFTIDKAIVPVSPVSDPVQEWAVGGDDSKFLLDWDALRSYLNENFRYGKNIDFTKDNGFKALKVKLNVGIKVGLAPDGLIAYAENDEEADNYEFDFETAPLNITKGQINLAVKDVHIPYFGNGMVTYNAWDFELAEGTTFLGKSTTLEEGWKVLVKNLNKVKFDVEEAEKYVVNTTGYTITATEDADNKLQATNYNVHITGTTGKLYIDPAQLTLKANDRHLTPDMYMKEGKYDEATKAASIEAFKTIDNASVQATGLKGGDVLTDVVQGITIVEETGVISLTPKANANYVTPTYEAETLIDGKLIIDPLEGGIVLTSEMAKYETDKWGDPVEPLKLIGGDKFTLNKFNNVPVSSIRLILKAPKLVQDGEENADFAKWNKNQWHALVLPFDVTARDMSYAFEGEGYVIVNVADSENTTEGNVKFMLPADIDQVIPANTPFCIKTADAYDYTAEHTVMVGGAENQVEGILLTFNRNVEKYGAYTIVNPAEEIVKDEKFENEWGYTFEGTYKQEFVIDNTKSYLRFLGPKKWNYVKSTSTTTEYTLPPYSGYVNLGEGFVSETREVIFTFEEEDGSTTSINGADFMNANQSNDALYNVAGQRVNKAQKGIYIQNNKKFVVK